MNIAARVEYAGSRLVSMERGIIMGNWKRRILAISLCAALIVSMVPAFAEESTGHYHDGINWEPFVYNSGDEIVSGTEPKYLYLTEDINNVRHSDNYTTDDSDGNLTICFNGHQMSIGTLSIGQYQKDGRNSLTLTDCSADGSGGLNGAFSLIRMKSYGIKYPRDNKLTINGGTYTIGRCGSNGMLLRMDDYAGNATINGGKLISRNGTGICTIYVGYGDTLTLNDGSILTYQDLPYPMYSIQGQGKFVMNGGEVKGYLLDSSGKDFSYAAGIAPMMQGIEIYGGEISGAHSYGVGVSFAEYGRSKIVADDNDDDIRISGTNGVESSPYYYEDSPADIFIATEWDGDITLTGNGTTDKDGYGVYNSDSPKDAKGAFRPNSVVASANGGIITIEGSNGGFYNGTGSKATLSSIRVNGVNSGIVNYGTMTVDGKSNSTTNKSFVWATGENGSAVKNYGIMRIGGGKDCSFSGIKYGIENYGTLIIDGNVNISGTAAGIYNEGTIIFTKNAQGCSILSDEGTGLYNAGTVLFGAYEDDAFVKDGNAYTVIPRIAGKKQAIYTTTDIQQNLCYGVYGDVIYLANGTRILCDWDIPDGLWEMREGKEPATVDFDEIPAGYIVVVDWGDCNGDVQLGNRCFQIAMSEYYLDMRDNGPLRLQCMDAYHAFDGAAPADQTKHPGQHLVTCSRCGLQYVNSEMTYEDCTYETREVINPEPANCQEQGTRVRETYCTKCGRVEKTEIIESVTGQHVYENGICTCCGEYQMPAQITTDRKSAYFFGKLGISSDYVGFYAMENAGNLLWYATENNNRGKTNRIINSKWVLLNDIDMNPKYDVLNYINSDGVPENIPEDIVRWTPIGIYNNTTHINKGIFDGNGHQISGLFVDRVSYDKEKGTFTVNYESDYVGLFGYAGYGCVIRNLEITKSYFGGGKYVGSFVGCSDTKENGTIENCTSDATIMAITGRAGGIAGECNADYSGCVSNCNFIFPTVNSASYVGGIVGYVSKSAITDCVNHSKIDGPRETAGGIAGYSLNCTVTDCANFGAVTIQNDSAGGIIGNAGNSKIEDCVNAADVQSLIENGTSAKNAGGIVGINNGTDSLIQKCYNMGNVTAKRYSGGIGGQIVQGTVAFCFNTGNIDADGYAGGITGEVGTIKGITNCFNTGSISEGNYSGSLAGFLHSTGVNFDSNYVLEGTGAVIGNLSGSGMTQDDCGRIASKEQFQSGMICYALNNGKSDSDVLFRQNLSDTTVWYPTFDATQIVYRTHPCEYTYTNNPNETRKHQDSNGDGICDVCEMWFVDEDFAVVAGYSLEINDRIAVDIYMQIDDRIWEFDDLAIVLTDADGISQTIPLEINQADAYRKIVNNEIYYVISVPVAAKDYNREFSVQIYYNGQSGTTYTFSIDDYIRYIVDHEADYEESVVDLARAMGLYCNMAACYFDDELNAETILQNAVENAQTAALLDKYSFEEPKIANKYEVFRTTGVSDGFRYVGESLRLCDNVRFRMYFSFAPEQEDDITKYGLTRVSESSNLCYYEMESLFFSDLGVRYTFRIGDFTVISNPIHYMEMILEQYSYVNHSELNSDSFNYESDPELVILMKSLYLLWQTALAYKQ